MPASVPLAATLRVIALLSLIALQCTAHAATMEFFVAPDGSDAWNGRRDARGPGAGEGPFATLERARDAIRALKRAGTAPAGGVTVWVRGGRYERDHTFVLTEADSGTDAAPIAYRAYRSEVPRLSGGRAVGPWKRVADSATVQRVAVRALGKVWSADLTAPAAKAHTASLPARVCGLELFVNDAPVPLAAWPDGEWAKIAGAPAGQTGDRFTYTGDEPRGWAAAADLWVHGYWTWDWADSYVKVDRIDPARREIVTRAPHGVYGYSPGRRWRAVGALELIDHPGEWCFDRAAGRLYLYPPEGAPADPNDAPSTAALLEDPIISLQGASHILLRGLTVECGLGAGIEIVRGSDNVVQACTLRNLGTWGVWVGNGLAAGQWFAYGNVVWPREGGERNAVIDCDLYNLGGGGILLAGGDRKTLTAAGHRAENNHVHHYGRWDRTYKAGISLDGVGIRVANNLIHDAPHQGIFVNGNDHLIELNEIHHVCTETSDAGAFYMGRDWAQRGNVVRWNYFHDLRAGGLGGQAGFADVMAVYLDDWLSGATVFGNIFQRAGRAVLIGGGRDNVVENNVFIDCTPAVHIDARGTSWGKYYFDGTETTLFDRLKAVAYDRPPYSTRYPRLAAILAEEPAQARGNRVARNICVGGRWMDLADGLTDRVVDIRANLTTGDPGFVDAAGGNFRLKKTSPAWKLGFEAIPIDRIGLRRKP